MTHDEARATLTLIEIQLDAVRDAVTDGQLKSQLDDSAADISSSIARLDFLTTGHGTEDLKTPKPL